MKFLDTHCHLDLAKNKEIFMRHIEKEKIYTLCVTNLPSLFQKNKVLIPETKYIKHALGYHPELIEEFPNQLDQFKKMLRKTRYIGEVGIDGSPKYRKSLDIQKDILENILYMSEQAGNKILTIHSRKAEKEVVSLIRNYSNSKKILHWYSGSISDAELALTCGCYFSFNTKMLSSAHGKKLLEIMPINRILFETDFPFGYKNETGFSNDYFRRLAKKIADIKNLPYEELLKVIQNNQRTLLII